MKNGIEIYLRSHHVLMIPGSWRTRRFWLHRGRSKEVFSIRRSIHSVQKQNHYIYSIKNKIKKPKNILQFLLNLRCRRYLRSVVGTLWNSPAAQQAASKTAQPQHRRQISRGNIDIVEISVRKRR